jgi:hypothetical protein
MQIPRGKVIPGRIKSIIQDIEHQVRNKQRVPFSGERDSWWRTINYLIQDLGKHGDDANGLSKAFDKMMKDSVGRFYREKVSLKPLLKPLEKIYRDIKSSEKETVDPFAKKKEAWKKQMGKPKRYEDKGIGKMQDIIEELESVIRGDLSEAIGKPDKKVIDAFLDKKEAEGKKLTSTGKRLDGNWMGGRGIAEWKGGKIHFNDLGSKAAQTIQRAVKKAAPKNWLAEDEVSDEEEVEDVEPDVSDEEDIEEEEGSSKKTIKVLADTDYRDKDAFFKMSQLLKGLAAAADEDETAKKYLSKVSDALTSAAKSVLGEDVLDEGSKGEYWGRRAKDSKIVKMKEKDAKEVVSRKAYSGKGKDTPSDWLMVWWVPSEYKKEAEFRIDGGYLKPVWDWGKGSSKIKLTFDSVVSEDVEEEEIISWDDELKEIIEGEDNE